ncbi:MAG: DNA-3-methyladenine glycosylase [Planctomycetota bacterium]|nr:DNA-3-methyladenine glycosylase [Planctomycetota bacterium]MDA1213034.1 DNA-3-methyladenine glycosylase [Planctomycetota bacterium]
MNEEQIKIAIRHLRKSDALLKAQIDRIGPFTLKLQRDRFDVLVRSIISQQISTAAARSIRQRLMDRIAPQKPTPEVLRALSAQELRSVGISPQKAGYLHDLSEKVADGSVRIKRLGRMSDEEVIEELVQVKGIGRWTAEMFLIFSLGRLDVLPVQDLGIRSAMMRIYNLEELPDRQTCLNIGEPWRPYASIASWYCWRSGE